MSKEVPFKGLNFLLIEGLHQGAQSATDLENKLKSNGAENVYKYRSSSGHQNTNPRHLFLQEYREKNLHFIISETINFPFYGVAAFDFLIPVVTPSWLDRSIALKRHIRMNEYSPDPKHVLKDTQIFVSKKFVSSSAEYLFYIELICALGGTCVDVVTSKTTHIVAANVSDPMVSAIWEQVKIKSIPMNFVFPTWLIDCFKQCKNMPVIPHQIELNDESLNEDKQADEWKRILDMAFSDFQSNTGFLKEKTFLIGIDLSTSPNVYQVIQQMIKNYGGKIYHQLNTSDVINNAELYDCFLGYTSKSKEYDLLSGSTLKNSQQEKHAGNLIWLFTMWSQDCFIETPLSSGKIIHAPFASKIFQRKSLVVSYTNYFGQQRRFIQRLTEILGGSSLTNLRPETTHLISGLPIGRKYEAAKQRGVCVMVNHLWLEDCYRLSSQVEPNQDKYQDYGDVCHDMTLSLGQMTFGDIANSTDSIASTLHTQEQNGRMLFVAGNNIDASETNSGHISNEESLPAENVKVTIKESSVSVNVTPDAIPPVLSHIKEKSNDTDTSANETFFEASDILDKSLVGKRDVKSTEIVEAKRVTPSIDASKLFEGISSDEEEENKSTTGDNTTAIPPSKRDISPAGILPTSKLDDIKSNSRQSSNLTPIMKRDSSEISLTGGSRRAAAAQAAKRLHSDMESLNVFEKQNKSKKGKISLLPQEEVIKKKNREAAIEARRILESCDYYKTENNRTVRKHNFNIAAVYTGCSFDNLSEIDHSLLDHMGIKLFGEHYVDEENKINCIISPKKLRTAKFLKALGFRNLRHAIVPDFITILLKEVHKEKPLELGMFQDLDEYMTPEVTRELLDKAQQHRKLFERMGLFTINMVDDVRGGTALISSILQEHGIQDINIISNKEVGDMENIEDNHKDDSKNSKLRKINLENGKSVNPPKYVLLATKPAQMKKFKNAVLNSGNSDETVGVFIMNWDWCVERIFSLDVDYSKNKNVLYTSVKEI